GVVELTAPTRVAPIAAGLKRLGVDPELRKYFVLHAQLDVEHSKAWNAEALAPLVAEDPGCARHIAEGALMRLICGEQCFEAYRAHLWAHDHPVVYLLGRPSGEARPKEAVRGAGPLAWRRA